jgi:hypothetical protein
MTINAWLQICEWLRSFKLARGRSTHWIWIVDGLSSHKFPYETRIRPEEARIYPMIMAGRITSLAQVCDCIGPHRQIKHLRCVMPKGEEDVDSTLEYHKSWEFYKHAVRTVSHVSSFEKVGLSCSTPRNPGLYFRKLRDLIEKVIEDREKRETPKEIEKRTLLEQELEEEMREILSDEIRRGKKTSAT